MQSLKTIAPLQQVAALGLAALLTFGVLATLSAEADTVHGAALASAQGHTQQSAQLASTTPARAARS